MTKKDKRELGKLLAIATERRLELDALLGDIETILGTEVDDLEEMVGNGISADDLIAEVEEQEAQP